MNPIIDMDELQERHLDAMLKLAFDHMDAKEVQLLVDSPDPELTPQEEQMAGEILQLAMAKADIQDKGIKRQNRNALVRKAIPRIIQVAAAVILAFAIATPIAFAASARFRSQVMRLLFEFDSSLGNVTYRLEGDAIVPISDQKEWAGEYFPTYIPEGFSIWGYDPATSMIEFRSDVNPERDEHIFFGEFIEDYRDRSISFVDVGNASVQSSDGEINSPYIESATGWDEDKWFVVVTFNMKPGEASKIVESVAKLEK